MRHDSREFNEKKIKYLTLLSRIYPDINSASGEIINLQAILNLPKGTEHFLSDIHGEFNAFNHVIKNASGVIKNKVNDIFGNTLRENEKKALATLIYYPEQKLESIRNSESDIVDFYRITLHRLIKICKVVSSKYTRSKVRKALPKEFAYILEELIHEDGEADNKQLYYNEIIDTIIRLDRAPAFIAAISNLIQRLSIDRLHVLGDIYDRGPDAHKIMDVLLRYHNVDIQWGNHDIVWMGAAAGSRACVANVIRIAARYANMDTIENGYGINLVPLATFAMEKYRDDPCAIFKPKDMTGNLSEKECALLSKIHKAISIIQFKEEAAIIKRHSEFSMEDRRLLDKIDYEKGMIEIYGKTYKLKDSHFPTINPESPYLLTEEEEDVIKKVTASFRNSARLQEHARLLFNKGSMYRICNSNLLFHGCIPLNEDGSFKQVNFLKSGYKGKGYFDMVDRVVREGYFNTYNLEGKKNGMDMMWYLWCGADSPLFGKKRMTTFERYFIEEKETHKEISDPYYTLRDDEEMVRKILDEFGISSEDSHIINGHVPVKVSKGESPVKANGKLYDIDGGFSKAYQKETGIAGYTLIYNSLGLILVSHEPFESLEKAIEDEKDIHSSRVESQYSQNRISIKDTDIGKELMNNINDLEELLFAYQKGFIKENN